MPAERHTEDLWAKVNRPLGWEAIPSSWNRCTFEKARRLGQEDQKAEGVRTPPLSRPAALPRAFSRVCFMPSRCTGVCGAGGKGLLDPPSALKRSVGLQFCCRLRLTCSACGRYEVELDVFISQGQSKALPALEARAGASRQTTAAEAYPSSLWCRHVPLAARNNNRGRTIMRAAALRVVAPFARSVKPQKTVGRGEEETFENGTGRIPTTSRLRVAGALQDVAFACVALGGGEMEGGSRGSRGWKGGPDRQTDCRPAASRGWMDGPVALTRDAASHRVWLCLWLWQWGGASRLRPPPRGAGPVLPACRLSSCSSSSSSPVAALTRWEESAGRAMRRARRPGGRQTQLPTGRQAGWPDGT